MTSSITFSGLGGGLDTSSIISQLMTVEEIPQNNLKTTLSKEQGQVTALQQINTALAGLFTSAQSFSTGSTWAQLAVTSSNTAFSATASGTASPGTLNVSVQQSATNSTAVLSGSTPFAAGGTYQITTGGKTTSFTVGGTGSTSDVAAAINAGSSASGLRAVVLDPNGTPSLELVSTQTGAASNFTVGDGTRTLVDSTAASSPGAVTTKGVDAQLTVDGVAVTSASNAVVAATGVTVTIPTGVTPASPQQSSISVSDDGSSKASSLKAFVDQVNSVLTSISGATSYGTIPTGSGASATDGGVLPGDSTLRSLSDQLLNSIFPADGSSLEDLGISVDRNGSLTFDSTKFEAAYASDPTGVQAAIVGKDTGTQQLGSDLTMHEVYADGFASRVSAIAQQWTQAPVTDDPNTPNADTALAKGGLLGQYIANFQDQIGDLNTQIADWDDRLAAKQSSLQTLYTNLSTTLATLQSQSSWLTSQIAGLDSSSN